MTILQTGTIPLTWASDDNRAAIDAFLTRHISTSMFPLTNLRAHPLNGDAPRAMRFLVAREGGDIAGVIGLSREGAAMPQLPPDLTRQSPGLWHSAAALFAGETLIGCLGASDQARALIAACGLAEAPMQLDDDEPSMVLSLDALSLPDCTGYTLLPLQKADRRLLCDWRAAYDAELLGVAPEKAKATAPALIDRFIADDSHRLLCRDGTPVAMTGFNAMLPQIVQIGGVYTPPALRGRGHARRAVALHLDEARKAGVTRAVLSASGDPAMRAYHSIGFRQEGRFTLALFDGPQKVAHA